MNTYKVYTKNKLSNKWKLIDNCTVASSPEAAIIKVKEEMVTIAYEFGFPRSKAISNLGNMDFKAELI